MRVVLVNWARVEEGASFGGGVNGYMQGLAIGLARRGHQVACISSGWTYAPEARGGGPGPCRAVRHGDFRPAALDGDAAAIAVYDIVNSPVLAPGIFQYSDPLGEILSPQLEAEFARLLGLLKPDVVHFQNIEGFSAGCVRVAREAGAKVFFSLHNYHTICPQVYLMQPAAEGGGHEAVGGHLQARRACFDFRNGRACESCIAGCDTTTEKLNRAAGYEQNVIGPIAPVLRAADERERREREAREKAEKERGRWKLPLAKDAKSDAAPSEPLRWPGRPVESEADAAWPESGGGVDRSAAPARDSSRNADRDSGVDPLAPLSNEPTPDPIDESSGRVSDYGRRRAAMVEMLSSCDGVLAVSSFVQRKFAALGVDSSKLIEMPIGSRMAEIAAAEKEKGVLADPPPGFDTANPRPVRLLFMGYNNFYKGLHMLLDSLEMLPRRVLGRIDLRVAAKDIEPSEERLRRLGVLLAALSIERGYTYDAVPRLCAGRDLGLVPSVWWDNGPQTVMEFFACGLPVLGAELGGIPDLVEHGENGLLHRGNDRADLARLLTEVVDHPEMLAGLRAGVRPPRTMDEHIDAVEAVYGGAVEMLRPPASVQTPGSVPGSRA